MQSSYLVKLIIFSETQFIPNDMRLGQRRKPGGASHGRPVLPQAGAGGRPGADRKKIG
jgi:hypothetical protein